VGSLDQSGTLTIDSVGTVTVGGGSGTMTQTGGTTTVATGGDLNVGIVQLEAGLLTGGGTISGNVTNSGGTINPGDPQVLSIDGIFTQTVGGTMDMDLLNTTAGNFDQINVTGDVNLAGALELTLEPGFAASVGDSFEILTWTGTEAGDFTTFANMVNSGGNLYTFEEITLNPGQIDVQVLSVTAAPEPSTFAMLFGALLAAGAVEWRRRRRVL